MAPRRQRTPRIEVQTPSGPKGIDDLTKEERAEAVASIRISDPLMAAVVERAGDVDPKRWTSCKVFSATKAADRSSLGERVTNWLREVKPTVVNTVLRQSSDAEFHCLTIAVFYR